MNQMWRFWGEIFFRDGAIHCHGYLIGRRCAKIQRVCRSSLSAECHATVTAGDYALRYQVLLIDIFTRSYQIRRLRPPADCPMLNPFSDSPSGAQLQADKLFRSEFGTQWNPAVKLEHEDVLRNYNKCESCLVGFPLRTTERKDPADLNRSPKTFTLPNPILLTDCRSLYIIVLRIRPNAKERCARIILSHLRDLQALLTIIYANSAENIGDVGKNMAETIR